MREKEWKRSEGEPGRVDAESSTLRKILDEFTLEGRPEQRGSDLNRPGHLMPESSPEQDLQGQMRAPPWTNPLELRGSSYPLRRSELRFPLN